MTTIMTTEDFLVEAARNANQNLSPLRNVSSAEQLDKLGVEDALQELPIVLYMHPSTISIDNNHKNKNKKEKKDKNERIVDLDSLIYSTILRFAGVKALIRAEDSDPTCSPSHELPYAIGLERSPSSSSSGHHCSFILDPTSLLSFLASWGFDLDGHLSESERSKCVAYRSLIHRSLKPALLYTLFCDPVNYHHFTRHAYFPHLNPFTSSASASKFGSSKGGFGGSSISGLLLGGLGSSVRDDLLADLKAQKMKWLSHSSILSTTTSTTSNIVQSAVSGGGGMVETRMVYAEFRNCLNALQSLIANQGKQFIIDDYPCSLDAIFFAYLDLIISNLGSMKLDSSSSSTSGSGGDGVGLGMFSDSGEGVEFLPNGRLKEILLEFDTLIDYHKRVKAKFSSL